MNKSESVALWRDLLATGCFEKPLMEKLSIRRAIIGRARRDPKGFGKLLTQEMDTSDTGDRTIALREIFEGAKDGEWLGGAFNTFTHKERFVVAEGLCVGNEEENPFYDLALSQRLSAIANEPSVLRATPEMPHNGLGEIHRALMYGEAGVFMDAVNALASWGKEYLPAQRESVWAIFAARPDSRKILGVVRRNGCDLESSGKFGLQEILQKADKVSRKMGRRGDIHLIAGVESFFIRAFKSFEASDLAAQGYRSDSVLDQVRDHGTLLIQWVMMEAFQKLAASDMEVAPTSSSDATEKKDRAVVMFDHLKKMEGDYQWPQQKGAREQLKKEKLAQCGKLCENIRLYEVADEVFEITEAKARMAGAIDRLTGNERPSQAMANLLGGIPSTALPLVKILARDYADGLDAAKKASAPESPTQG